MRDLCRQRPIETLTPLRSLIRDPCEPGGRSRHRHPVSPIPAAPDVLQWQGGLPAHAASVAA